MGMFDNVKKAARKTKLQGELMLVQRELESLQKKSGAELFTVLYDWEQQLLHLKYDDDYTQKEEQPLPQEAEDAGVTALPVPALTIVYHAAREDIMDMVEKRQFKVEEVDVVECKLENTVPATTAKAKAQNATHWMSNTGTLAKLRTEIVHLEREINIRKEIFGVQVFNEIDFYDESNNTLKEQLEAYQQQQQQQQEQANNSSGGSCANSQKQEDESESLSPTAVKVAKPPPRRTNDDIFALLHRIKLAMDPIMERKRAKQQEIAALQQ
jgi:hypothetical protein